MGTSAKERHPVALPVEIEAKGLNFRGFLHALERLYDAEMVERVIDALPDPDARNALRYGGIVPTGWYPVAWHRGLHAAARSVTKSGPELARRIGYEGMKEDLGGVHRFVASMLSPQTLVRIGNRLWSSYWHGGVVTTVEHGRGRVQSAFRGCHGFDRNEWEDIQGSCLAILESAGARDVRLIVLEGGRDNDANAVLEARWTS
jgi:hypothetical protein